ncbi:hypothetical protein B5K06_32825 [Rhizobium grahamii]|uniref:Uncharacterized protein n=2 Tax=Rhizobium grahamii TaxID=1120045 RepID=A0A370KE77_9HYPH|nr:hypothetical protein B5K06_32825 [Rhizobium grahamii]
MLRDLQAEARSLAGGSMRFVAAAAGAVRFRVPHILCLADLKRMSLRLATAVVESANISAGLFVHNFQLPIFRRGVDRTESRHTVICHQVSICAPEVEMRVTLISEMIVD